MNDIENKSLTINGDKTTSTIIDFWKWSASDLLSNANRGRFAEFIVATATQFDFANIRQEWDEYDIHTSDGIKIEVKSAAYVQSWEQSTLSKIIFSIKKNNRTKTRNSDVYVFCILKHKERESINPLELSQWEFIVVPTYYIDNYKRSVTYITPNSLLKISSPIDYAKLNNAITISSVIQKNLTAMMTIEQYKKLLSFYKLQQQGLNIDQQLKDEHLKANLDKDKAIVHKEDTDTFDSYIDELNLLLYRTE